MHTQIHYFFLDESPHEMECTAKNPASNHLFTISDNTKKLQEDKAQLFHHLVAKLLYLCKRLYLHYYAPE